jgi:tripartite-type tricarboxylate transporter receptor subunit TctC
MKRGSTVRWLATAPLFVLALAGNVMAQSYPSRQITIVVPYPPGGPTDIVARIIGQKLSERMGQPVIIDNRAGAGGNIGASAVAKAAPDGHTLLLGTTAHAINPHLFKSLDHNIQKDFAPVVLLTSLPLAVVTRPGLPAKNIKELIALAKTRPLTYASSGNGQSTHLAAELFKSMTGTQITHVPYKGSAPALMDLMGGQVDLMFNTLLSSMPHVKAGRLNALAVTPAKRAASAPELPTVAESGVPGYEADAWSGLLAPAGTPDAVVSRLNKEVNVILHLPDVKKRFLEEGADLVGGSAEQFTRHLRSEVQKWGEVVRASGARIE